MIREFQRSAVPGLIALVLLLAIVGFSIWGFIHAAQAADRGERILQVALSIGLVDRVVPAADLEAATIAWATQLANGAVVAMGLAKSAIDDGLDGTLSRGIDLEAAAFVEVFGTDDAQVGIASFLEHGPGTATFSGR